MDDNLKIARRNKGLTQLGLSQKLQELGRKVSPQQISSWERGDYFPSHQNLSAICKTLEVNLVTPLINQDFKVVGGSADKNENLANEFSLVEKKRGGPSVLDQDWHRPMKLISSWPLETIG